jgi:hypothetical protein
VHGYVPVAQCYSRFRKARVAGSSPVVGSILSASFSHRLNTDFHNISCLRSFPPWLSFRRLASLTPQGMDDSKCSAFKAALAAQPEPRIASIERFFDGNDDVGSIGWNLPGHPGMEAFRDLLTGLLRRPDVQAVYAQIDELDLGEDCWPSTNIIFVVGAISPDELRNILSPLQPDEVCAVEFAVPEMIKLKHPAPVVAAKWA